MKQYQIKAEWTRQMAEELKYLTSFFLYEGKADQLYRDFITDRLIIEKYFKIEYLKDNKIFYSITNKILRKIKLLKINDDKVYDIIQRILDNSVTADTSELFQYFLADEMSKSIDNEIMKNLVNYAEKMSGENYLDSMTSI